MANDVTLPGTGAVVHTEDIGAGVQAQVVKVAWGVAGTATDVAAAAPLPVQFSQRLGTYATKVDVLGTELDSLASAGATVASAAYDNSSNAYPLCDMRLTLATQGSARSAGANIAVYMVTRFDGSNFDRVSSATAELVAVFPLDAATTATKATRRGVSLPPEQVEFFAVNNTGYALATGNLVSIRPYYLAQS